MGTLYRVIRSYILAFGYMGKGKIIKYVLYTAGLSILLGVGLLYGIWSYSGFVADLIQGWIPFLSTSGWLDTSLTVTTGLIMVCLAVMIFKYLVMLIAAPFLGAISDYIELQRLHRRAYEPSLKTSLSKTLSRNTGLTLRLILREIIWSLPLLILMLIPVFNMVAIVLLFLVQSYYAGIGAIDPYQESRRSLTETIRYARQHRFSITLLGAGFISILLIPVLGILLAPVVCTIAGTIVGIEMDGDGTKDAI